MEQNIKLIFAEILLETKIVRQRATRANQSYMGNYWEDYLLGKEIECLNRIIEEEKQK
jgi:hypothetical protein